MIAASAAAEEAPRPRRAVRRELCGAGQRCGCRREPSPFPGPARRAFQLGGDLLVRADGRGGEVPGASVDVRAANRCVGQGPVGLAPAAAGGTPVDRGANQGMAELDVSPHSDDAGALSGRARVRIEARRRRRPRDAGQVARGFGGGEEEPGLGLLRESPDLGEVVSFQPATERERLDRGHGVDDRMR